MNTKEIVLGEVTSGREKGARIVLTNYTPSSRYDCTVFCIRWPDGSETEYGPGDMIVPRRGDVIRAMQRGNVSFPYGIVLRWASCPQSVEDLRFAGTFLGPLQHTMPCVAKFFEELRQLEDETAATYPDPSRVEEQK